MSFHFETYFASTKADDQNNGQEYKSLNNCSKFNERQFSDIVTGNVTWFHVYEPVREIGKIILQTKQGRYRRPALTKSTASTKKVLYCEVGIAVQNLMPKAYSVTGQY